MTTTGMQRHEPYTVPAGAQSFRNPDDTEVSVLRRDNTRLRREAANQRACAEAERAESARLRRENQRLIEELAAARATVAGTAVEGFAASVELLQRQADPAVAGFLIAANAIASGNTEHLREAK